STFAIPSSKPPDNSDNVKQTTATNLSLVDASILALEALPHNQTNQATYHKNVAAAHAEYLSHLSVPNSDYMFSDDYTRQAIEKQISASCNTSAEDAALTETVSRYLNAVDSQGNPQPIPWNKVSKQIPQRTGAQCQARWTEALDPRIKKGKWSPSEDSILKEGVKIYGRCWIRIAEMIQGRTQSNENNVIMTVTPTVQSCDINPILTPPITPSTSTQVKLVQGIQSTGSFGPTNISLFEANENPVAMFQSPITPGFPINVSTENLFSNYIVNTNQIDNQFTYHNSPETALCFYNVYNNNNA
ncbi:4721_t:CDS:2, partial [Dentiscutata heterogama]